MAFSSSFSFALLATAICAAGSPAAASTITIPLKQDSSQADPLQHAIYAAAKHGAQSAKSGFVAAPETLRGGFWYGQFDVGNGKNLSLLIDSGSSDVGLSPGKYKPSSQSVNRHQSSTYEYATVFENGCGLSNISYSTYSDTVSFEGLTASNQSLYYIKKKKQTDPGVTTSLPGDGIVGFGGNSTDYSLLGGLPFFYHLCTQKKVKQCRYGLAFDTCGTGQQILGGVDTTAFKGALTRQPVSSQWYSTTNVAVNNKPLFKNVNVLLDSGTAGIVGPVKQVREYFKKVGIQAATTNEPGCGGGVIGYYPCDKPPSLGFQFGPQNTTFNVEPSAFQLADNGNNNCTVWITGLSDAFIGGDLWIIGQNWMQGKYVDFDYTSNSVGIAPLVKK